MKLTDLIREEEKDDLDDLVQHHDDNASDEWELFAHVSDYDDEPDYNGLARWLRDKFDHDVTVDALTDEPDYEYAPRHIARRGEYFTGSFSLSFDEPVTETYIDDIIGPDFGSPSFGFDGYDLHMPWHSKAAKKKREAERLKAAQPKSPDPDSHD